MATTEPKKDKRRSEKGVADLPGNRADDAVGGDVHRTSAHAGERPRRQRLHLPFEQKKTDAGEWAYDHRIGLAVTVIAYLIIGIVFVGGKIVAGRKPSSSTIVVDLKTLAELEAERDRLQREVAQRTPIDWGSIRNTASNENALNENLEDDRGTNTSELNESAEDVERRMQANREAYEKGMAEARAIGERRDDGGEGEKRETSRAKGRVTVSYSLDNPVRHHRYLDKPAYKCEGGGDVEVSITVNRNGEVIAASVVSGGDECMRSTALKAARESLFDINPSAPARQTGTITYIFIPQ